MEAHFQRTFWPITATAAFFGLALIEYPLGTPHRFLSLIYAIGAVSMQLGMNIIFMMWPVTINTIFLKLIRDVMMFCCNFINIASICLSHWHGKKYHKCIERLNEVDETMKAMGIETDCSKWRRVGLISLLMWASMYILINTYISAKHGRKFADKRIAILVIFMYMPLYVRMLIQMQFLLVLGYAGTRFDCISDTLRKITMDNNNCTNWFGNSETISVRGSFVPDEKARRIIWTVMRLHFKLCEILRDINTVFEIQMSLQIGFDYVCLLCSVIFILRLILLPFKVRKLELVVGILSWTLTCLVDVILTNHLCETVGAKAKTVCDMAAQLLCFMDDGEFREDVSLLILQAKLRPLRFTCLDLYYFGYHFMYEIFSTVATTAVIVLQQKVGLEF